MKASTEPAVVRTWSIIKSFRETLNFEQDQIQQGWRATYTGDIDDVQAVFDAVPEATPEGMIPLVAATLTLGSLIQIVTHNVTVGLINNPSLMGNKNIQQLVGVLNAIRDDKSIPKVVEDTPPFNLTVNKDGTVSVEEYPKPEIAKPANIAESEN